MRGWKRGVETVGGGAAGVGLVEGLGLGSATVAGVSHRDFRRGPEEEGFMAVGEGRRGRRASPRPDSLKSIPYWSRFSLPQGRTDKFL